MAVKFLLAGCLIVSRVWYRLNIFKEITSFLFKGGDGVWCVLQCEEVKGGGPVFLLGLLLLILHFKGTLAKWKSDCVGYCAMVFFCGLNRSYYQIFRLNNCSKFWLTKVILQAWAFLSNSTWMIFVCKHIYFLIWIVIENVWNLNDTALVK